jgi:hypothetical protein
VQVQNTLPQPKTDILLASAARTTTATTAMQVNDYARGVLLTLIVSAETADPLLTPKIQYTPDNETTWIDYAGFTQIALSGAANYSLLLYPGILASADGSVTESFNLPLPRHWRLVVTAADSDSATYAVHAMYL